MAFASLNPYNDIWHGTGLKYLLLPGDAPVGAGLCAPATATVKASRKQSGGYGARPAVKTANTGHEIAKQPERVAPSKQWQPKPLEEWPEAWRAQLARTRKGRFAWSWWDLGLDLQNGKNEIQGPEAGGKKRRSDLLKKILSDLSHPGGSHTFWPITMPTGPDHTLAPDYDCFWAGIQYLECRGVILLGSPAARAALAVEELKPLTSTRKFGKFVWILWDPNVIAATPGVYERVLGWLRPALRPFIRI